MQIILNYITDKLFIETGFCYDLNHSKRHLFS